MDNANNIMQELKAEGYDYRQIAHAMCDGAYLLKRGINQELAKEIHSQALAKLKSIAEFNQRMLDACDDSEFWD